MMEKIPLFIGILWLLLGVGGVFRGCLLYGREYCGFVSILFGFD